MNGNDMHGIRIQDRDGWKYDDRVAMVFNRKQPDAIAGEAIRIIERWALVAALPDGEDSAGRQKLRMPTPEELVGRAFDIAEAMYAEAVKRNHIFDLPDLNQLNAEQDDARRKKRVVEKERAEAMAKELAGKSEDA